MGDEPLAEPAVRPAWRSISLVAVRSAGLLVAVVVTVSAMVGWLYWLRGPVVGWPGPLVANALPLDELPGHAAVPLLAFLPALALACGLLGLAARAARLDRTSAALVLALLLGGLLFTANAFSLFVVRQVTVPAALHGAAGLQSTYLAVVMAGAAGALLGRPTRRVTSWNRLLAWVVSLAGLLDLVSAIVPHASRQVVALTEMVPGPRPLFASALMVPVGVLLLVTARGLSRRRRPAWMVALALLGTSSALHLLRGPHYAAAIATAAVAVVLFARRQDFGSPGDPSARPVAALRLVTMLASAFAFGIIALLVNTTVAGLPFDLGRAVLDTARGLVGLPPSTSRYLLGRFPEWFPWSVMSIAAIGVVWAAGIWLAPWRHRLDVDEQLRRHAESIVRAWGGDTLAPFALRHDKALFFYRSDRGSSQDGKSKSTGDVVVAYRVVRGVALVSGDPVGPTESLGPAIDAFVNHAHLHGWRVAVLGASGRLLDTYRSRGLHAIYHGDEAVIDVARFSLDGGRMRSVRQGVHRVDRSGYRPEVVYAGGVTPALRAELEEVERIWLRGRPRTGFAMQLDELFGLGGDQALFVLGRARDGRVAGFLHVAVCLPSRSLTLSSMPRLEVTPNGYNAWLIVNAVRWAAANGFDHLSLNFSPFARLLTDEAAWSRTARVERDALMALKGALSLQLDNLLRFNRQFDPGAQPRYVIFEHRTDLPRVAVAAMAAEGYLPFSERARGRDWELPDLEREQDPAPVPATVSAAALESATVASPAPDTVEGAAGPRADALGRS